MRAASSAKDAERFCFKIGFVNVGGRGNFLGRRFPLSLTPNPFKNFLKKEFCKTKATFAVARTRLKGFFVDDSYYNFGSAYGGYGCT